MHAGGQTAPLGLSNSGTTGLRLVWPTMEQVRRQPASRASKGDLEFGGRELCHVLTPLLVMCFVPSRLQF